ncbi:hypothetical protein Csp1_04940 [Corynebacterium provencense]|jgi:hypothetical protein|uniref:Uncharacterized protein n=1 Tax=Corynebacterium provencense TaxID=1737425 RepID=A0A2Z3YV39_9CORY|nr:hypothetical protein Csp1_04940 [Corynebacterium provencense]
MNLSPVDQFVVAVNSALGGIINDVLSFLAPVLVIGS